MRCLALVLALVSLGLAVSAAAPAAPAPEIQMDEFLFRPATATAGAGDLVRWRNRGTSPHNATATTKLGGRPAFRTGTALEGGRLTARAPWQPGTYRYVCTIHPKMRGTLVVARGQTPSQFDGAVAPGHSR